ncbi:MAG TPA: hypothetical protein PK787_08910, partial [Burkholderiaceae bacterium]|nr:hypothetical protein [Burkholderiaceae bacterium]
MSVQNRGGRLHADVPVAGPLPRRFATLAWRAALCGALSLSPLAMPAQAQTANGGTAAAPAGDMVTLNFKDADVDSVVGAFGHLLDRTFVIDPRVRGKMTLETPRPVTRAQA